jgi:hypothetical protein
MTDMTKVQRDEAEAIAKRNDVWDTAVPDTVEMFVSEANDYTPNGFEQWIKSQRESRPYLFIQAAALDLETLAFEQRNVSARGRLYKELGPARLDERAKAWGLKGADDFRTKGERPDGSNDGDGKSKTKTPDASNPFSRAGWNVTQQGRLMKTNKTLCENLARAAGVSIGATKPVM